MAATPSRSRRVAAVAVFLAALAGCGHEPGLPTPGTARSGADPRASAAGETALVAFDTTPFPFHGTAPGAAKPFMDVDVDGRLGHSSLRNGVLWEDRTYNDRRVLLAIPGGFDPRRPCAIVVFLHGNGATLGRDVRDRQRVPAQLATSGLNAVLVAPQFAVDAKDSSAGRFWEAGVFDAFLGEAATRLAALSGAPEAAAVFDRAPVILAAYSGGYLAAAAIIRHGGAGGRLRGLVLLDALYGEEDAFQSFAEGRGDGFLVSLYGRSSREGNARLKLRLAGLGVGVDTGLRERIAPGSVTFVDAGDAVAHGDFVTDALGGDPLATLLKRVPGFPRGPETGQIASGAASAR